MAYTEADIGQTYSYTIVELPGAEENMTYSGVTLAFTVSVEDAGEGELALTTTAPAGVTFTNIFDEPAPEPVPEPNFGTGALTSNIADSFE